MEKTILAFILSSLMIWEDNDSMFGEEIRALDQTILKIDEDDISPILEHISLMITLYPNNEELGYRARKLRSNIFETLIND